jgi:inner membrane protein
MMAITHAIISTTGTAIILSSADPMTLAVAVLGSQLPDLDSTSSIIGQIFFPISSWIEDRFPHRTITHSLLATAFWTVVSSAIGYYWLGDVWGLIALPLGHVLACFSDCFTRQGVQLFYPYPVWAISVSNPNRRLRTGSPAEYYVLVIATALLLVSINIFNGANGGITNIVSVNLGLRNEIVKTYNESANNHLFYVNIKGYKTTDRSPIDKKYLIVDNVGEEFIVTDGENIYQTGKQIIVTKLELEQGEQTEPMIKQLTFDDELATIQLKLLWNSLPEDKRMRTYLSGKLTVDYAEDIQNPDPNQYPVVSLGGDTIELSYCSLPLAINTLKGQYAIGDLSVLIK